MKKIILMTLGIFLFSATNEVMAQNRRGDNILQKIFSGKNTQKTAQKNRKKNYQQSNAKAAFKPVSKTLYTDGVIVTGASTNWNSSKGWAGITGEYYLSPKSFVSANLSFSQNKVFNSYRRIYSLGSEFNYHLYSINNTFFLIGFAGSSFGRQTISGIEPTMETQNYLWSGNVGGEVMINFLYNWSVFGDFRNKFSINERDNHFWFFSFGIKRTL